MKRILSTLPEDILIREYNFNRERDETIAVSVENNVSDIPAFVFNGKIIEGKKFSSEELTEAIEEWKSNNTIR